MPGGLSEAIRTGTKTFTGRVCRLAAVPAMIFERMKAASSKGRFLAQNIRGAFRYARA
jgi:hypothetical protein